jgi:hypothetical protein
MAKGVDYPKMFTHSTLSVTQNNSKCYFWD